MFSRFGRHISHRDQLSPQRAPEQSGDGGQRHSVASLLPESLEESLYSVPDTQPGAAYLRGMRSSRMTGRERVRAREPPSSVEI